MKMQSISLQWKVHKNETLTINLTINLIHATEKKSPSEHVILCFGWLNHLQNINKNRVSICNTPTENEVLVSFSRRKNEHKNFKAQLFNSCTYLKLFIKWINKQFYYRRDNCSKCNKCNKKSLKWPRIFKKSTIACALPHSCNKLANERVLWPCYQRHLTRVTQNSWTEIWYCALVQWKDPFSRGVQWMM